MAYQGFSPAPPRDFLNPRHVKSKLMKARFAGMQNLRVGLIRGPIVGRKCDSAFVPRDRAARYAYRSEPS